MTAIPIIALAASARAQTPPTRDDASVGRFEPFIQRFVDDVWPLMSRGEAACLTCHVQPDKTTLTLFRSPRQTFLKLAQEGRLDPDNPSGVVARLTSISPATRMPPPPLDPLGAEAIGAFRAFVEAFGAAASSEAPAVPEDERFPDALLEPYVADAPPPPRDNTLLTYHQLRRKVRAIFDDDWTRAERDLFLENIDLFGGADFQRSFAELDRPTPGYLAALDRMAADVAARAYLNSTGPFADIAADPRNAVEHLFRAILLRPPTTDELERSVGLMLGALTDYDPLADATDRVAFDARVAGASGPATERGVEIEIVNAPVGLTQQYVNLNHKEDEPTRRRIGETFHLKPDAPHQWFRLANAETRNLVSLQGVEIVGPLPDETSRTIRIDDPAVRLTGPWKIKGGRTPSIDDAAEAKGECVVEIPLGVEREGDYQIFLLWPSQPRLSHASNALVEIAGGGESRLARPLIPEAPPAGEAKFFIDQTRDNIAFWDLKTAFRFETDEHGVEVSNEGTHKRVTADAVRFDPVAGGPGLLIDNDRAEGRDKWKKFTDFPFRPYNITGPDTLSDDNKAKGDLALRYLPARERGFDAARFYRVGVGFPGQASNERRAPVVVRAAASSPIVRVSHPMRASLGAEVVIDATASYDLERSGLRFDWAQVGGPKLDVRTEAGGARLRFNVESRSPVQAAWEGLARALVRHPDFFFTRPISLDSPLDAATRRRLQLVKIAQDLVARPPTEGEFARLDAGADFAELARDYLDSPEFREFYARRVRLFLESRASETDEEPVRLWCYVAFNDRPFQEILTADYTVDAAMQRRPRPGYFGRTGLLTMPGFIDGKPGLPHFNYAAQVAEKFLGYVFDVPDEIVDARQSLTASSTTDPQSACYSCHKVLTPLAYQRTRWDDSGVYRIHDSRGLPIDDSDREAVADYAYAGRGLESFALAAQKKERFIRTMIDIHYSFYMGRAMRFDRDERDLYRRLWEVVHEREFSIRGLIEAIVTSPEYLGERRDGP